MNSAVVYIATALLVLASCRKPDLDAVENLNNNTVAVMGHGGMGIASLYGMNTMESVSKCIELGAAGTEIDVQMTSDSVLVAYHNQFLEDRTAGVGKVHANTSAQIAALNYIDLPHQEYALVQLEDILSRFENRNLTYSFDCKLYPANNPDQYHAQFARALHRIVNQFKETAAITIESQSLDFLLRLQQLDNNVPLYIYQSFDSGIKLAIDNNLAGVSVAVDGFSKEDADYAHANGKKVITWNTHTRERNREAIEKNADYIQTDILPYLLRVTDR